MKSKFSISVSVLAALTTLAIISSPALAQTSNPYLSCRILAQSSPQAVSFAGASIVWSDAELDSIKSVPNGEEFYDCSRELRVGLCRTMAGSLVDSGKAKDDAITGAFIGGMGGGGAASGGLLFGGASMVGTMMGSQMDAAQCYKEMEELTVAFGNKVSMDWSAAVPDAHLLNYEFFMQIVNASSKQNTISKDEVARVINFTDRAVTAVNGQ